MPSAFESKIITLTNPNGYNAVNDASPGMSVNSGTGQQKYSVLGARVVLGPDEVLYYSTTGTLYGGIYQYVRFRSTDATSPAVGLLNIWDLNVAEDLYQVSNLETINNAAQQAGGPFAGVGLNAVTLGNYGFIQIAGKATVAFASVFKGVAAIGVSVYQAVLGAGADNARADVLDGIGANPTFDDIAAMQRRYIGEASVIPVVSTSSVVQLAFSRLRV